MEVLSHVVWDTQPNSRDSTDSSSSTGCKKRPFHNGPTEESACQASAATAYKSSAPQTHGFTSSLVGLVDGRHTLRMTALDDAIIRVSFERDQALQISRTWMVAPGEADIPAEGRCKTSTVGFSMPPARAEYAENGDASISTALMKCTVSSDPLRLQFHFRHPVATGTNSIADENCGWQPLWADRETGAYYMDGHGERVQHYTQRSRSDAIFGLGEVAGELERSGRRFTMDGTDAMGYDAEHTDPLYKHWPFYLRRTSTAVPSPSTGTCHVTHGVFYDNMSKSTFDFGCEIDNYHGPFSSFKAESGDLDFYVLLGPTVLETVRRFSWLSGKTAMPPRWSLGYSGSTMSYTDADNAHERLLEFIQLCELHRIPCSSFQLSSGYTSIGSKRYVFHWNRHKVPEPRALTDAFHAAKLRLAANIKPCLLLDHPLYAEAEAKRLFVRSGASKDLPATSRFWGARGSHLDFTNDETCAWWIERVTAQLLDLGIDSTWNDNNEYRLEDERALCCGFGVQTPLRMLRPLQTLLMMRCSWHAQRAHAQALRPWLISRSGMPGMQRYAQTWSGDNYTEWKTIRFNQRMGLGLSLSGCYNLGHDVGGFDGPPPEPELLVRWVQNGVFHPRFTIHSWNTDGSVNEPWMHAEATQAVRAAISLRYALIPYLYELLRRAHTHYEPVLRPTFLDHEADTAAWRRNDECMLGRALLFAPVVERGVRQRRVHLPANGSGWWDWHEGRWHAPGIEVTLPAPLDRLPMLAAAGSIIPLAEPETRAALDGGGSRFLRLFPLARNAAREIQSPVYAGKRAVHYEWIEDGGETDEWLRGEAVRFSCEMLCSDDALVLRVAVVATGAFRPAFDRLRVQCPLHEMRPLSIEVSFEPEDIAESLQVVHDMQSP